MTAWVRISSESENVRNVAGGGIQDNKYMFIVRYERIVILGLLNCNSWVVFILYSLQISIPYGDISHKMCIIFGCEKEMFYFSITKGSE